MKLRTAIWSATITFCMMPAVAQEPAPRSGAVPIYTVTVVERTTKAINYQYRSGPTLIDFRGTVLLPQAKGDATVESKRGRTEIDVRLEKLTPPTRYGREYLTYVLWAVTPDGAARNLGEIIPNGSDKAHLRVTTGMQTFGLIVTAEPYSSTHQPSDVVVMENQIRPETTGRIQPIQAKYELMPRGHYTWEVPDALESRVTGAPKVSMDQYEAMLEIYEAQNATEIARAAGAEQYAPHTFAKATQLLQEARQMQANKTMSSVVVEDAREAAETAEDARTIAERRRNQEKLATAEGEVSRAQQAQVQAQAQADRAVTEADRARAEAAAERSARERAEADAAQARERAAQVSARNAPPAAPPLPPQRTEGLRRKAELRMRLLEQLNAAIPALDTPRGLVVTVNNSTFSGAELRRPAALAQVAAILRPYPNLRVEVQGYTDSPAGDAVALGRAQAVRRALVAQGLAASGVTARNFGDSRPLVANSSAAGREENRRVEIVISGDPIGDLPFWDRTYSLSEQR